MKRIITYTITGAICSLLMNFFYEIYIYESEIFSDYYLQLDPGYIYAVILIVWIIILSIQIFKRPLPEGCNTNFFGSIIFFLGGIALYKIVHSLFHDFGGISLNKIQNILTSSYIPNQLTLLYYIYILITGMIFFVSFNLLFSTIDQYFLNRPIKGKFKVIASLLVGLEVLYELLRIILVKFHLTIFRLDHFWIPMIFHLVVIVFAIGLLIYTLKVEPNLRIHPLFIIGIILTFFLSFSFHFTEHDVDLIVAFFHSISIAGLAFLGAGAYLTAFIPLPMQKRWKTH